MKTSGLSPAMAFALPAVVLWQFNLLPLGVIVGTISAWRVHRRRQKMHRA